MPIPMPTPLITFIIPTYNTPPHLLHQCIESILALDLFSTERQIILVDDGSTIPAITQVPPHIAPYITPIRLPQNQGLAAARNAAIPQATGTYIQFIDADDALLVPPYNALLQQLSAPTPPDVLMFNHCHHLPRHPHTAYVQWSTPTSGTHHLAHHSLQAACWGYIFKRSIMGSLRFPQGMLHEDEYFTPRLLLRAHTLISTHTPLYYYRQRANSICHTTDRAHRMRKIADKQKILIDLSTQRWTADQLPAITRRLHQLAADLLYNVWTHTHSLQQLRLTAHTLGQHNLYPLPLKHYTPRYWAWALALKFLRV